MIDLQERIGRDSRQLPPAEAPVLRDRFERPCWHTLDRREVEATLRTGPRGLTAAEVATRLLHDGPNDLPEPPPRSDLAILLHQFTSPLIYLLLLATVVTLLFGEQVDAAVIAVVLVLNAIVGFTQERHADRSARALARMVSPRVRAIREGRECDVDSRDLVSGDLVILESGVRVPADMRLVETTGLWIDESALTGESEPVHKQTAPLPAELTLADRTNLAHSGTIVVRGRGRGYVVATGAASAIGSIAAQVGASDRVETPLQARMARFARIIGVIVVVAAAVVFSIGIAVGRQPAEMFMVAVTMAVSAIPEGLPVAVTVTLAIGVRRMARRNAIVRNLGAVETLGSTTVVCTDKTGTLTENRMTVRQIWSGGRSFVVTSNGRLEAAVPEAASLETDRPLYLTLLAGVFANEAELAVADNRLQIQGDPTDAALLVVARRAGLDPEELRAEYPEYAEIPFESERQFAASVRVHHGRRIVFVKGSPERVTELSSHLLTTDGIAPLDREAVLDEAHAMASRGLRVLAMAYRDDPLPIDGGDKAPSLGGLTLVGLQGLNDPPRAGVREAIVGCRKAGIRTVMITGDHAAAAQAIARELDIVGADAPVLTGATIDQLDDATLRERVREVAVYARTTPDQKLRIVRALQSLGEVVAVTGDGVNDAPALRAAEIGVAMGKGGTDVARDAADVVLADDNFTSIYAAVEEGRITFDNLRKVTFMLVSTGAAEILAILAALVLRWPLPFLPAQILWLNLATNGLQDVALAFEPGERDVLRRPPRPRNEGILSALLWERAVVTGLVMAAGTLALFRWELLQTDSLARAQTVALTTMVVFQMLHIGSCRSERGSAFATSPLANPFLFLTAGTAIVVHAAALYLAPTQYVLRVTPIDLDAWVRIVAVATTVVVANEVHKLVRGRQNRSAHPLQ